MALAPVYHTASLTRVQRRQTPGFGPPAPPRRGSSKRPCSHVKRYGD